MAEKLVAELTEDKDADFATLLAMCSTEDQDLLRFDYQAMGKAYVRVKDGKAVRVAPWEAEVSNDA